MILYTKWYIIVIRWKKQRNSNSELIKSDREKYKNRLIISIKNF